MDQETLFDLDIEPEPFPPVPPGRNVSLVEAQGWLRKRLEEGTHCQCCGQLAKIYKRNINRGMARALIVMYRTAGTAWAHKPTILSGLGAAARDESLCRFWGLIEEDDGTREDGSNRTGWWRVTPQGRAFVLGMIAVPKYARIYDSRCLGFDGDQVRIWDALKSRFDYDALMRGDA